MIRVTVWNEFLHERTEEKIKAGYPDGIHTVIAEGLSAHPDLIVRTAASGLFQ